MGAVAVDGGAACVAWQPSGSMVAVGRDDCVLFLEPSAGAAPALRAAQRIGSLEIQGEGDALSIQSLVWVRPAAILACSSLVTGAFGVVPVGRGGGRGM